MKLGRRIWTLWQLRPWLVGSALLALLVALWSVAKIGLLPPRLTPRALEMATASTHVVVDTPKSTVLDLRVNTDDLQALTQRAVLLGNVIANQPVTQDIARRANVPVSVLQVSTPLTPSQPLPVAGSANNSVTNIVRSTDQYRLSINVNPSVPMLDIYSQAPTAAGAAVLANAAVDGLRSYVATLAAKQHTPPADQIHLLQLGRAQGAVINHGIQWQVAVFAFVLTFSLACATVILVIRIQRGWKTAVLAEHQPNRDSGARMEVVIFLRRLWRCRIQLAVGALVALAVAVALGGSPVAPSGLAATRILVDTPRSALIATASSGSSTLYWRATLLGMLLGTDSAREQLAREMYVPSSHIAVIDQQLTTPSNPASLPVAAIQAASAPAEPYVLTVATSNVLPIVAMQASAPDQKGAARLAQAAVRVLQAGASPHDTPQLQGLRITEIDPVRSIQLPGGAGRTKMFLTAFVVFVLWSVAVAIWAHRHGHRPRRRLPRRARAARV